MTELVQLKCEVCRIGAPLATDEEIAEFMTQLPEWQLIERSGMKQLERSFKFKTFAQALAFTNSVGALAEEHGHHPAITTEWGRVTVAWYTHKIKGLHKNDFVMAARSSNLYQPPE